MQFPREGYGLHGEAGREIDKVAHDALCKSQDRAEILLAQQYLPELESAGSPSDRRRLFRVLTESNPVAIIDEAFREYDRTAREAFLLHAASLLEFFGKRGWSALLRVAGSGRLETELFLGLIAGCPEVTPDDRIVAFHLLAKFAPPLVRLAMLEHLASLGSEREQRFLAQMGESDPDETVRMEVEGRLSMLPGRDS